MIRAVDVEQNVSECEKRLLFDRKITNEIIWLFFLSNWFGQQTSQACINACYFFNSGGKREHDSIDNQKVNKFTKTRVRRSLSQFSDRMSPDCNSSDRPKK